MRKMMKGMIVDKDCYIISENEVKELVTYRKTFNRFKEMYVNNRKCRNNG